MIELEQFVQGAYGKAGQPEAYEDTAATLDKIGNLIDGSIYTKVADRLRVTTWEHGTDSMRSVLAIGSIAICSMYRRDSQSRSKLYFYRPEDLAQVAETTNSGDTVATSMIASGNYYLSVNDYLPLRIVRWAATAARSADKEQAAEISQMMRSVVFSNAHTDSEDSDDPHYVEEFLVDTSLPEEFRTALMWRAYTDASLTRNKPWVWQSQISGTLARIAESMDNPLRFDARKLLGRSESDEAQMELTYRKRAEQARVAAERTARIDSEAATLINAARTIITQTRVLES